MATTKKTAATRIAALIAFAAMTGANLTSVIIPAIGHIPSGIYSVYPILLLPARPTFLILGLIHLLLGLYTVWQLASRKAPEALTRRLNSRFLLLAAAQIAWTFAWRSKNAMLTMLFMLALLISVILIIHLIAAEELTIRGRFFIKLPFFVFFAWITVTTAANAAALIISLGVDSFGPVSEEIAIAILAAGTILGMWTGTYFRSASYLLVFIWTYTGILLRHVSQKGMNMQYPRLVNTTVACIVFLAAALAVDIVHKCRDKKQSN